MNKMFLPNNYNLPKLRAEKLKAKFIIYPSEFLAKIICDMTGEEPDWSDADYGEAPKKNNYE